MAAERPPRGSHPPGTFHHYNNWDCNVLGTSYEHRTGTGIFEAFKREIADPIGMEDFEVADGSYQLEPAKSRHPAYAFRMTARDLARFGVLFQRNGAWDGRPIVPPAWIAASWTPSAVHDSVLGLGRHFLIVAPRGKLVLVHRVDTDGPCTVTSEQVGELRRLVVAARVSPGPVSAAGGDTR